MGNGFDRNLGLKTTYSDFVKYYKNTVAETEVLEKFRKYIKDNEELWSAAEIALGQYTNQFEKGEAEAFADCQRDFCEFLAKYLKEQEMKVNYDVSKELILKSFSNLNHIIQSFPTREREEIRTVYNNHINENISFNFICFNYTSTLSECLNIVRTNVDILGNHKHINRGYSHEIGSFCHVHGTVDKDMVFGVNDETQISKEDIFDCEYGDLYKNLLIKVQANASYLENADSIANRILQSSHLIYVYGMSIGDTDKLWWERISKWLNSGSERQLIVQKYSMPAKGVIPTRYQLAERKAKREITRYSNFDQVQKNAVESRIHITNENIFEDIKNIGKSRLIGKIEAVKDTDSQESLEEQAKELIHT